MRFLLALFIFRSLAGCTSTSVAIDTEARAGSSPERAHQASVVPRRLLVVRLGAGGPEVLRSVPLHPVSRSASLRRPPGWDGRYAVVDQKGLPLAMGAFRIPRRVHALFDEVEGPAGPASAPLFEVVVWLRLDTPPGAARVELWDAGLGAKLGQVPL